MHTCCENAGCSRGLRQAVPRAGVRYARLLALPLYPVESGAVVATRPSGARGCGSGLSALQT
eukprot:scaffold393867_cov29-Prasinocladus_malaysianus.AAC.1